MTLENIYYFLSIIFMVFSIIILIGIVAILFYIMKAIRSIHQNINDKIDLFAKKATSSSSLAVDIGTAVAGSVIKRAKEALHSSPQD